MKKIFLLLFATLCALSSIQAQKTKVVGWGDNSYGQINVPEDLDSVVSISAGAYHSLALKSNGKVNGWGYNFHGQTNIPNDLSSVVSIAAGGFHSLALKSDGSLVAWGDNYFGQLDVPDNIVQAIKIVCGINHTLVLCNNGKVVSWGSNFYGESIVPSDLSSVVGIAAGGYHSLALKSDGSLVAWGYNEYGQTNVPSDIGSVVGIAAGLYHSLALKSDGSIVAWGRNDYNQTDIPNNLHSIKSISACQYLSIALKNDGSFNGWGLLSNLLANPLPIYGPSDLGFVSQVSPGYHHILSLVELKPQSVPGYNLPSSISFGSAPKSLPNLASSLLPVSYSIEGNGAIINNNTLYFIGEGVATIIGRQMGNNTYSRAPDLVSIITITGFSQTVSEAITSTTGITNTTQLNDLIASIVGQNIENLSNNGTYTLTGVQLQQIIDAVTAQVLQSVSGINTIVVVNTTVTSVVTINSGLTVEEINALIDQAIRDAVTGLASHSAATLHIYPNPSQNGVFIIEGITGLSTLQVISLLGEQVSFEYQNNILRLLNPSSGIYYLRIFDKTQQKTIKLLVAN